MKKRIVTLCIFLSLSLGLSAEEFIAAPNTTYSIQQTLPHNPKIFTQGLVIEDGKLYQSSGLYGKSFIQVSDLKTQQVIVKQQLPKHLFAEGISIVGNKLYVLTWKGRKALVLDKHSLKEIRRFNYLGQGWGLAYNDAQLIMSDGTDELRFINPDNFHETHRINVTFNGKPLGLLNELEWIKTETGEARIWANIFQYDRVAVINPSSGVVEKLYDFSALREQLKRSKYHKGSRPNVLNGIAYDAHSNKLYLTGKYWPQLYQLSFSE